MLRSSIVPCSILALGLLVAACHGDGNSGGQEGGGAPVPACSMCGAGQSGGKVTAPDLVEISGVVASAIHADVFYVHNDSGDSARFFAIDKTGALLGTFNVTNADAIDWEDIARGPCKGGDPASGSCIYLGDIGDNGVSRKSYTIYRVKEPTTLAPGQQVTAEVLPFQYPDGSHNCETLLVHPVTGEITVVTKVKSGASTVYEFPMPIVAGQTATLVKKGSRSAPTGIVRFTGGDVHPGAKGVLLRTYSNLFYFPMAEGQSVADALLGDPCLAPVIAEDQGEAVGFFAAGDGYVTLSEGKNVSVNLFSCPGL